MSWICYNKTYEKNERQIAELERQEKFLTDIDKAIKNGQFDLSEFSQGYRNFLNSMMKG